MSSRVADEETVPGKRGSESSSSSNSIEKVNRSIYNISSHLNAELSELNDRLEEFSSFQINMIHNIGECIDSQKLILKKMNSIHERFLENLANERNRLSSSPPPNTEYHVFDDEGYGEVVCSRNSPTEPTITNEDGEHKIQRDYESDGGGRTVTAATSIDEDATTMVVSLCSDSSEPAFLRYDSCDNCGCLVVVNGEIDSSITTITTSNSRLDPVTGERRSSTSPSGYYQMNNDHNYHKIDDDNGEEISNAINRSLRH